MAFDLMRILKPVATNIVVALVIFLVGTVIAKIAERVVQKLLHELEVDAWLRKANIKFALEQTLSQLTKYVIYFLTIVITLNQINLTTVVVNIIASAIMLLVFAGILLGVKDFIPNFLASLALKRRGNVKVGDIIRVRDLEGEVREINLLETRVKTVSGDILFVPNSYLTKNEVLRFKRKKTLLK